MPRESAFFLCDSSCLVIDAILLPPRLESGDRQELQTVTSKLKTWTYISYLKPERQLLA
jgi:hypothetical protein